MKRYLPFLLFGLFALCMAQVPGIPDSTFPVFRANLNASLAYISSALAGKEPALGNPTVDDYVLSSKASGKRSWVPQTGGGGGGGTGNAGATVIVTNSATPTFPCPSSTAGTVVLFKLLSPLATSITSSTLSGCTGGSSLSSLLTFVFTQAASGGPYTVAMPTGFSQACQISPSPSASTTMTFAWDGTTANLISCSASAGPTISPEGATFGGDVFINTSAAGVILTDSASACWRIVAAPSTGALSTTSVSCPAF